MDTTTPLPHPADTRHAMPCSLLHVSCLALALPYLAAAYCPVQRALSYYGSSYYNLEFNFFSSFVNQ